MRIFLLFVTLIIINPALHAEEKKAYFAGGCFWCMEESFDQVEGVISTISGYSGGHLKNPKYADVIYTDSGHVEAIEVTYDSTQINYQKLLDIYWKNVDPFDALSDSDIKTAIRNASGLKPNLFVPEVAFEILCKQ